MDMSFDTSDFSKLATDLSSVSANIGPNLRKAMEVAARNVKDDWAKRATGLAHAPEFPKSIGYDLFNWAIANQSEISAEIGPDKNRTQGALGNLIEYGSKHNPAMGLGTAALAAEEDDFARGIELAEQDARRAADL